MVKLVAQVVTQALPFLTWREEGFSVDYWSSRAFPDSSYLEMTSSKNRYAALATEHDDFDREFAEATHIHILGSPPPSPRLKPDASAAGGEAAAANRSLSLESDASARSFDSDRAFNATPYRPRPRERDRSRSAMARNGAGARRVSFSDVADVHIVDDDDEDDLSASFARLFALEDEDESESESGDELARWKAKCELLESENFYLTEQLKSMRMLAKSHRKKLEKQTRLASVLKKEVSNLQSSLWASVTGSQPRESVFEGSAPAAVSAVQRGRANTELLGPLPKRPTPTSRRRAHTDAGVGRLALSPNSPSASASPSPPKAKKRPSRLSFGAFFGRPQREAEADAEGEDAVLIGEEKVRARAQSVMTPRTTSTTATAAQNDANADESRARAKSFPADSGNSYPALQRKLSILEAKLTSSRKENAAYKALEAKFLNMKLEHAMKCAELEEMQMQFSVNAREQQSVVEDLNGALVDKVNLKTEVDQLRDRLKELTKEHQLLQQNHRQMQHHIDVSSRKMSVSLAAGGANAPALPAPSNWRMSIARRFSALTSPTAAAGANGEESNQKTRERSKTHHGNHQRPHKAHRGKRHSKRRSRTKSEVPVGMTSKTGHQTGRRSLPPQPLHLIAKAPKKKPLDVLTETPPRGAELLTFGEFLGGREDVGDENEDVDEFVGGNVPLAQFRGWFGGASKNAPNVKGDAETNASGGGAETPFVAKRKSLQEELMEATGSSLPLTMPSSEHAAPQQHADRSMTVIL